MEAADPMLSDFHGNGDVKETPLFEVGVQFKIPQVP